MVSRTCPALLCRYQFTVAVDPLPIIVTLAFLATKLSGIASFLALPEVGRGSDALHTAVDPHLSSNRRFSTPIITNPTPINTTNTPIPDTAAFTTFELELTGAALASFNIIIVESCS
jgi:hypothetical protein